MMKKNAGSEIHRGLPPQPILFIPLRTTNSSTEFYTQTGQWVETSLETAYFRESDSERSRPALALRIFEGGWGKNDGNKSLIQLYTVFFNKHA